MSWVLPLHLGVDALYRMFFINTYFLAAVPMAVLTFVIARWTTLSIAAVVALDGVALSLAGLHEFQVLVFPLPVKPLTILGGAYLVIPPLLSMLTVRMVAGTTWASSLRSGLLGWMLLLGGAVLSVFVGVPIGHLIASSPSLSILPGFLGFLLLTGGLGICGGLAGAIGHRLKISGLIVGARDLSTDS